MIKDNYSYPMIFTYLDDGIEIRSQDFKECVTFVEDENESIEYAMDILSLTIIDYESENKELPNPTDISKIQLKDNERLVYINVWMPYFRSKVKETYVKKTLTIPAWLDVLAKNNNVNFSNTLVKALKKELKLEK